MAGDKKITQLDAIPIIATADLFAAVDATDTVTKKATISQIKDWLEADQIHFTYSSSTATDYTLKTDITALADVALNGIVSEVTAYANGMAAGNELVGFKAILNNSISDTNGQYIGFKAEDYANPSANSPAIGVWVGTDYSWGLFLESPSINYSSDSTHILGGGRATLGGDGPDFELTAAAGRSSASEARNGGDFIINGGLLANGGTAGEVHLTVQGAVVAKVNSDSKFELTSGTGCNEIVTGITAANTDDQLATAKSIYDAILELSHTQYEPFTATAGQLSFTILGPTPLNAHAAQIAVQGIVYQYGAGNDFTISGNTITWINTNYTLQLNDVVQIWYDGPGSEAREWGSHSGTLPVAGGTLVVTAATLGLTDARQITDATLWGRGTDQQWYKAMNTWGGVTHEFNFTIPTLADPNVGDLVIQVAGTASSVASQPFKISFEYTSTNFLT